MTLAEDLPVAPTRSEIVAAAIAAFEEVLGIEFDHGELTGEERRFAERLIADVEVAGVV